jgi:DNA-binding response OmpR family regulator
MSKTRILIVEDEPSMVAGLRDNFEFEGYEVVTAGDGEAGLERALADSPDLVILDVMMPKLSGLDVCKQLKSKRPALPIILLTARGQEVDKVVGLELGADDYVTKPFGPEELLARIRVALRRVAADPVPARTLVVGPLTIDYDRRRLLRGDDEVRLTPKEFDLLSLLARNHDRVLTHRTILKAIWGPHAVEQPEHLWTLVAQLRRKIEDDPSAPRLLLSEPWVGYRLSTEPGER